MSGRGDPELTPVKAPAAGGTLHIVATPIGNLEDMTYRAVRVLQEADLIACEDTRHSRGLLDHYSIRRPLVSLYRENEAARSAELLQRLQGGEHIALITDAGTPLVSDPGARLVRAAAAAGIRVVPVPGPSAAMAALMASALGEPVLVEGFLPARSSPRRRRLAELGAWSGSVIFFEAPHRLRATLADVEAELGAERPLVIGRELTKLHEEFLRGSAAAMRAHFEATEPRGEFTLVAGPAPAPPKPDAGQLELDPNLSKAELKQLARQTGLGKREIYRRLQQLRGKMEG